MGRRGAGRLPAGWRGFTAVAASLALTGLTSGCSVFNGLVTHKLGTPAVMTLTSTAFTQDELIPQRFTCYGAGVSPPLYWTGAPQSATKSFAIVVDDSQAPITPYIYWVVFDIKGPGTSSIAQNTLPPGALQGLNSRGTAGYDPICPAHGSHLYRFTVYALNAELHLAAGTDLRHTWSAIANHVIAIGRLTAIARPDTAK